MVMNPNGVKIKEYGTNFHYDLSSTFVKFGGPRSQNAALFENLMRVLFSILCRKNLSGKVLL